jgi:hypothetical protein
MNVQNGSQIDSVHCRAICDEIGDRLRAVLRPASEPLPNRLQMLIDQLAAQDHELAPSIVPSMEDMTWQPAAVCQVRRPGLLAATAAIARQRR